jgi:DNA-binding Lrp family transcriptional regulator
MIQPTAGTSTAGHPAAELDQIDWALLARLTADGRLANNALAAAVGIAPSTCLARVRSLRERGVITGVHTEVDLSALGTPLQAMIAVRLQVHVRDQIDSFRRDAPQLPGVLAVFHVAGGDDYLLHVATRDSVALRDFVLDHLTGHPAVHHTETSLIFEHVRGVGVAGIASSESVADPAPGG